MSKEEQPKRKPFLSWVEIIVILTIIGMLAALLLPPVTSNCGKFKCLARMRTLCIALHAYHDAYQSFPPAYTVDTEGMPLHSWRVLVLPYLKEDDLYRQIRLDEPWDSEFNRQFHNQMPTVFSCSSALKSRETVYQVVTGSGTLFPGSENRSLSDVTRDTSDTIMLVESTVGVCWMAPVDLPIEALEHGVVSAESGILGIGNYHKDSANIAMVNGIVEFIPNSQSQEDIRKMKDMVQIE
jgi:hypothetical protein